MVRVYEELAEPSRRQILSELLTCPKNVGQLVVKTGLKQPNVSNHLARLRERGLVTARKLGREVYYSLASPEVEEAVLSANRAAPPVTCLQKLRDLVPSYTEAAVAGDEQRCLEPIDEIFRHRVPLLDLYEEVLAPAMVLVGSWWEEGRISEAEEHAATQVTLRMMSRASQRIVPPRSFAGMAMLGCPPGEEHHLGLRMAADILQSIGCRTVFLGQNVPELSLVTMASQYRPTHVLISATSPEGAQSARPLIRTLKKERKTLSIICGGQALAALADDLKDDGASEVLSNLRQLQDLFLEEHC